MLGDLTGRATRAGAAVTVLALAGLGLAGTHAGADPIPATVAVNAGCYVTAHTAAPMTITGSGYLPGDQVTVTDATGLLDTTVPVDASGHFSVRTAAPSLSLHAPGEQADAITATDVAADGTTYVGTTSTLLSLRAATVVPLHPARGLRALGEPATWTFSGFTPGVVLWGHYTFHGRQLARQPFGRPHGPCGLLTVRRPLFPTSATPAHLAYTLQLDSRRHYSSATRPRLLTPVGVGS